MTARRASLVLTVAVLAVCGVPTAQAQAKAPERTEAEAQARDQTQTQGPDVPDMALVIAGGTGRTTVLKSGQPAFARLRQLLRPDHMGTERVPEAWTEGRFPPVDFTVVWGLTGIGGYPQTHRAPGGDVAVERQDQDGLSGHVLERHPIQLVEPHPIGQVATLGVEAREIDGDPEHAREGPQLADFVQVEHQAVGVEGLRLHVERHHAYVRNAHDVVRALDMAAQGHRHAHGRLLHIDVGEHGGVQPGAECGFRRGALGSVGRSDRGGALRLLVHVPFMGSNECTS